MKSSFVQGHVFNAVRSHGSTSPLRFAKVNSALRGRHAHVDGKRPKLESKRPIRCNKTSIWLFSTFSPARSSPLLSKPNDRVTIDAISRRTRKLTGSNGPNDANADKMGAPDSDPAEKGHQNEPDSESMPPLPSTSNGLIPRPAMQLSKDQLRSLVSGPVDGTAEDHYQALRDPFQRGFASSDGPNVRISDSKQDTSFPSEQDLQQVSPETQATIIKLCNAIRKRVRRPENESLEDIYAIYKELPAPRMLLLQGPWRNLLFRIMALPRKRNTKSMLRYFALIADVKSVGLTLSKRQWNSALAFAARYTAKIGPQQLKSAMELWWEMEREGGETANEVTFNILFDAATKAGSFALAEMIYKEMGDRNIPFNHYHHVTLMFHFGLQRDSGGIRAAYREMVEAGELVDTTALTCVISGFLRCGEEAAAEDTYMRMKAGGELLPQMPEKSRMVARGITRALIMLSGIARRYPELRKDIQSSISISPNLQTFKAFIQHYSLRLGDLGKVVFFLNEMDVHGVLLHPTIFLAIFKGFFLYGGCPGTQWSADRLDRIVKALYQAQDSLGDEFRIDAWVAIWLLKATKQCCPQEELANVFKVLTSRWDVTPKRQVDLLVVCESIVGRTNEVAAWRLFESVTQRRKELTDYDE